MNVYKDISQMRDQLRSQLETIVEQAGGSVKLDEPGVVVEWGGGEQLRVVEASNNDDGELRLHGFDVDSNEPFTIMDYNDLDTLNVEHLANLIARIE